MTKRQIGNKTNAFKYYPVDTTSSGTDHVWTLFSWIYTKALGMEILFMWKSIRGRCPPNILETHVLSKNKKGYPPVTKHSYGKSSCLMDYII